MPPAMWSTAWSVEPVRSASTVNAHTNWPVASSVTVAPPPLYAPFCESSVAPLPNDTLPSGLIVMLPAVPLSDVRDGLLTELNGLASTPRATVQVAVYSLDVVKLPSKPFPLPTPDGPLGLATAPANDGAPLEAGGWGVAGPPHATRPRAMTAATEERPSNRTNMSAPPQNPDPIAHARTIRTYRRRKRRASVELRKNRGAGRAELPVDAVVAEAEAPRL